MNEQAGPLFHAAAALLACEATLDPPGRVTFLRTDGSSVPLTRRIGLDRPVADLLLDLTRQLDGGIEGAPLLDPSHAERHAAVLAQLADPGRRLAEISLVTPAERQLLDSVNATASAYPRHRGIGALFDEAADRHAERIALWFGEERWTYAELKAAADGLAARLIALGVEPGERVGLRAASSAPAVAAIVGIVKAGAVYAPIDGSQPAARQRLIAERAGLKALVDDPAGLAPDAPAASALAGLVLPLPGKIAAGTAATTVPCRGDDPLYLLFTSGTTGIPKGVLIPHHGVTRMLHAKELAPYVGAEVIGHVMALTFDPSAMEIWGALLNGRTLAGLRKEEILQADLFRQAVKRYRIGSVIVATAVFNLLVGQDPAAFAELPHVYFGGESPNPAACLACLRHSRPRTLTSLYGPTEATVTVAAAPVTAAALEEQGRVPPLGLPMSNCRLHILDEALRPCPPGIAGEIAIGGDGLALAYLNEPALTAERFVHSPALPAAGRLYLTGDRGRLQPDGRFVFLGRNDHQVKIRGQRIELEEIQLALTQAPAVAEAAVIPLELGPGDLRLAAYLRLAPGSGGDDWQAALRRHLEERLPRHMVPSWLVRLDALPLNSHGKLDRSRLPDPRAVATASDAAPPDAADDPLLDAVAERLRSILKLPSLAPDLPFTANGGNSLLAARLIQDIQAHFGIRLSFATIMSDGSARQIAGFISVMRGGQALPGGTTSEIRL